uniref:KIB1-4 beta-propeller domain-containing protein n=1 Tax=Oryza barthii TaxID=65489 RepID=A0A0D3HFP4_9ORYZ
MVSQLASPRPRRVRRAGGGGSDWASLPADLMSSVLRRLAGDRERARFGAVGGGPPPPGCRRGHVPFAVDVPAGSEYLSSSRGYLALSNPTGNPRVITLFNPVTGRRIPLPPIGFFKKWHDVATIVLSADPDTAEAWSAVAVGFPANCLAYYSSATNDWKPIRFNYSSGYAGVEHFRGRFYVAFKSEISVLEVDVATPAAIKIEIAHDDDDEDADVFDIDLNLDHETSNSDDDDDDDDDCADTLAGLGDEDYPLKCLVETHLVDCGGELLVVSMHDEVAYKKPSPESAVGRKPRSHDDERWVDVHRVEWLESGAARLVRMEDLGGYALFVGRNHAFALSPEEFPACQPNCIYSVEQQGHPDGLVRVVNFNDDTTEWACPDEDIFPDDDMRGSPTAGWARRGWYTIPKSFRTFEFNYTANIAFSAAGAWTPLGFSAAGYAGVEHYRGRFYVAFKSQLCVCDVEATVPAVIPLEQLTDDDDDGGSENVDTGRRVVETHLVECDGELLLVSVRDNLERNPEDATIFGDAGDDDDHDGSSSSSDSDGGGDGRVVEVLRVEWVAGGAVRLVRQEDLRSRALFLGRNRAFALSPAEFPACRANCVYLVDQQGHPDGRVRVFDMNADGRWEPEEAAIVARNYALRDETIYPDDGRRDAQSAGWARRGWFFPKY